MTHNVSNEYKQVIYSGDARNKLKLLFNNVELQDADRYCEKLTVKSRIIPNGAKIFSLNNFISKEADLILHDIDTSIIQNQVSISIGTLVGNSYEYVPIGIFNIENQPTNDKNKTTIKLRDNSVKFDFNYNAQPLIEQNGGVATKLQILQDICLQAGVTCNITSFVGYLDEIGVYDNTITAREYISRLAEQAGKIATINRSGELIFVDLNNLTTWEIPIEVVEKYENGTKFKIGRVVYEDGIIRYETPTSNDDTLFLDGSNNYINGELVKEQASSNDNTYYLEDSGDSELAYLEIEGKTTQETRSGKNLFNKNATYIANNSTITINNTGFNAISNGALSRVIFPISVVSGQQYRMSFDLVSNGEDISSLFFVRIRQGTGSSSWASNSSGYLTAGHNSFTLTATETGDFYLWFYFNNSSSVAINYNVTLTNIQVEKGTVETAYEEYGAMPSPDYPSELVNVGYENLLNFASIIPATTSTTVTLLDTGINLKNTSNGYGAKIDIENLKANTDYYISYKWENVSNGLNRVYVFAGSVQTTTLAYLNNGTGFKFNTGNNTSINIWFYAQMNSIGEVNYKDIQLLEGTQAHSYIPYGKYGIEITNIGKNLLEPNFQSSTTAGVTVSLTDEGWLVNGELTTDPRISAYIFNKTLPAGTYIVNGLNGASGSTFQLVLYKSGNIIAYITTSNRTFTLTEDTPIALRLYLYRDNGAFNNLLLPYQLERGTQVTEYEAYQSNTYLYTLDNPLRSIGDTKDLLYIKNGMLYVERKIGKYIWKGTETWNTTPYGTNSWVLNNIITTSYDANKLQIQSNIFKGIPQANRGNLENDTIYTTSNIQLQIRNTKLDTLTKVQEATKDNYFHYELAEPYTEELGQVDMPSTYESTTHINIDSNIDTNTYIQYKENKTQLEAILNEVNQFDIDSLKTGKILGNPAIDSYDLIKIHDKSRNLFKVNALSSGIVTSYTNGEIVANGTTTTSTYYSNIGIANLSTGTYHFSFNSSSNLPSGSRILLIKNGTAEHLVYDNNNFTISAPTEYMIGLVLNTGNFSNVIIRPQIEKGNVATDYVSFKDEIYTTLATNDLVYTGVLINTFDTQIGEEAKEQNVFINGEETFKKWARTTIDNVEGTLTLQAGQIDEANGKINETNLIIEKDGALLNVLANNSNIDVQYDSEGNPLSGEVREVTTTTGFKFNAEGMTIEDTSSNFKAQHRNTGTYYKDGDTIVGQYTKDGSKQKDLELFGVYYYGKNDFPDTPMFIAQLYTDENGEECFGHFYNRGD